MFFNMSIFTPLKTYILRTGCLAMLISSSHMVFAEKLLVITHKNNDVPNLTKQQTVNLFMGGANQFGLTPVSLSNDDNLVREKFNTFVIGMTEPRIRSYWAQMQFSGRGKPPESISTQEEVIKLISTNTQYIGYVSDETPLPDNVQIVFSLDTSLE